MSLNFYLRRTPKCFVPKIDNFIDKKDLICPGISVGGGSGEGCSSKSDTLVGSIKDRVESLEETLAVDEIESRSAGIANVCNNQVNVAGSTTKLRIKVTRPDLGVRGQMECSLVKTENMYK